MPLHKLVRLSLIAMLALFVAFSPAPAQEKKEPPKKEAKKPPEPPVPATATNVKYGLNERNVLDFFQAKSEKPTPLVFCIHGGGWQGGDKRGNNGTL
jgi:acetyl esterase/lipase